MNGSVNTRVNAERVRYTRRMLSLHLFGTPHITLDDKPLNLTRRKSRALVYYLAAHPRPVARDQLLAVLWPDQPRPAAQQVLRTTLHGLRQSFGATLRTEAETLALEAAVDVRTFESQIANLQFSNLTSTLALYTADFLSSFTLPDVPEYDDWLVTQREHYRRLATRGLTTLATHHEATGDYSAALTALERALTFDALQEDLQRAAIRLHYLAGDRTAAIRRYDHLRKLLDAEMGIPPMTETRQLYDDLINDRLQKSQIPTAKPQLPITNNPLLPFIGRVPELAALQRLLPSGHLVLIEGEAGLGKTRLAEEFLRHTSALVLTGRVHEHEHAIPYHAFIEALRGVLARPDWPTLQARLSLPAFWLVELARLLPELAPHAHDPAPHIPALGDDAGRLWESVHQFLSALARLTPIIVFLDDLHWAEPATLDLLQYLVQRAAPALGYVATTRPAALSKLTHTLLRDERLTTLILARFTPEEILALAHTLSPRDASALADWLTPNSEGNPYILAELARYVRANNLLTPSGMVNLSGLAAAKILPQTIYAFIQARLTRLSDAARRMLDAAVAVGREFEFAICAHAAALSETAALDALDELLTSGFVQPVAADTTGRHYRFDHTLTMEVAYREVGEARHRLIHHRVAEALETAHGKRPAEAMAGVIAWHFNEGQDPARAAPYALRAGQAAAHLSAWDEAISFYEQALAGDADDPQRAQILFALGEARLQAGQNAPAAEALQAALMLTQADPNAGMAADIQLALGQSFLGQARFDEAVQLAQHILASGPPQRALEAQFLWGAALSVEGADLAGALLHLQQAETLALLKEDGTRLAQVKFEMGSVAAQQGDLPRAIALYRESLAAAEGEPSVLAVQFRALTHNNLAYHLHLLGDPSALAQAQQGIAVAQESGALFVMMYLLSTSGEIALAAGDLAAAEAFFREGLTYAERFEVPERMAGLTANLGLVAQARGELTLAVHRLSTALARADALGTHHLAARIRLWLAPLLPAEEARHYLAEVRALAEAGGRKRLLEDVAQVEQALPPKPAGP